MKPGTPKFSNKNGFGVVEIIVATTVIGIVLASLAQAGSASFSLARRSSDRTEAAFLLKEGVEATRFLRDKSWSANINNLSQNQDYYFLFSGSDYQFTASAQPFLSGKFQRVARVFEVKRNAQSDIDSVGTVDLLTKRFEISVSWFSGGATTTESVEFYLTNLFDN